MAKRKTKVRVGQTKTVKGKQYKLNQGKRWERAYRQEKTGYVGGGTIGAIGGGFLGLAELSRRDVKTGVSRVKKKHRTFKSYSRATRRASKISSHWAEKTGKAIGAQMKMNLDEQWHREMKDKHIFKKPYGSARVRARAKARYAKLAGKYYARQSRALGRTLNYTMSKSMASVNVRMVAGNVRESVKMARKGLVAGVITLGVSGFIIAQGIKAGKRKRKLERSLMR